jgi:hypothetical protein
MPTEAPTKSTKDQVKDQLAAGVTDAAVIAEKIGVTKASVYGHIRKIKLEAGEKPRGRGRPPKAGNGAQPQPAKSRPAPPKAGSTPTKAAPAATESESNGNLTGVGRFPIIREAVEKELAEARKNVATLERLLEAASK